METPEQGYHGMSFKELLTNGPVTHTGKKITCN